MANFVGLGSRSSQQIVALFLRAAILVCLPLLIFFANYAFLLSSNQYLYSLSASTAALRNSQPEPESAAAAAVAADVIAYVRGDVATLSYASYFRPEELLHLADVRKLVSVSFAAIYFLAAVVALSVFGLFVANRKFADFAAAARKAVLWSGAVTVALAATVFLLSLLKFDSAFSAFHFAFFRSSQWQFPSHYLLVNLFTTEFFARFAKDVVAGSLIQGMGLVIFVVTAGKLYGSYKLRKQLKKT